MSHPSSLSKAVLEELLARATSTSVEDMYRLADEERARLVRLNSGLSDPKEDSDAR